MLAALVIALPLHSFGNEFYVLNLVGALLRFDVAYVGQCTRWDAPRRARSLTVLVIGLIGGGRPC